LWLVRQSALQNLAVFAGLVITILGIADIITVPAGTGHARYKAGGSRVNLDMRGPRSGC
jgi:uncharacterized protein YjlB